MASYRRLAEKLAVVEVVATNGGWRQWGTERDVPILRVVRFERRDDEERPVSSVDGRALLILEGENTALTDLGRLPEGGDPPGTSWRADLRILTGTFGSFEETQVPIVERVWRVATE